LRLPNKLSKLSITVNPVYYITNMSKKTSTKKCNRGCGTDIYLSDQSGKWLPYNLDNTLQDCRPKEENRKEITLEMVQKKLESIGVTQDVEKLMQEK
jgi:hypothetical protein